MNGRDTKILALLAAVFLGLYLLPVDSERVRAAVGEGLTLTRWYAREHVVLCLLPALLIAGAIATFVDRAAVMKYLGPQAKKSSAYAVGATSGGILAVCSCTVLPLFAGIYRMGAGLGPASAFLYAGPAINVLAVILTARVLGAEVGFARAIGAVVFSIFIGLAMAAIFERKKGDEERPQAVMPDVGDARPLRDLAALFGTMIAVLVFANWNGSSEESGLFRSIHEMKWWISAGFAGLLGLVLWRRFGFPLLGLLALGLAVFGLERISGGDVNLPFGGGVVGLCLLMALSGETGREWWRQTLTYTKLIAPLLLLGVFFAGLLLGAPGSRGLIPPGWVESSVGGNGLGATLAAAIVGAFMYFATLTEVPILEGLIGAGMGEGPALALLLAGPALSLPNMIVINSVLGPRKTTVYCCLVVVGSTAFGLVYGLIV